MSWLSSRWISLASSPRRLDWSISRNTTTNYVGTTNNVPLILRGNNTERIRTETAETVINEDTQNYDFKIKRTWETEMFL